MIEICSGFLKNLADIPARLLGLSFNRIELNVVNSWINTKLSCRIKNSTVYISL